MSIKLIKPDMKYLDSYNKAVYLLDENKVETEYERVEDYPSIEAMFKEFDDFEKGVNLPKKFVPASTRWLVNTDTKEFLGKGSIRHYLNDNLKKFGGHVGYLINPKYWKQGYGTLILQLLLEECKDMGMKKVLITCHPKNIPSRKIIEKNKGIFSEEEEVFADGKNRMVRRYWIYL